MTGCGVRKRNGRWSSSGGLAKATAAWLTHVEVMIGEGRAHKSDCGGPVC